MLSPMTPANVSQFKAPRRNHLKAMMAAANYVELASESEFGGLHVEPLFEGGERELVGYTVRITDLNGYTLGYV